MFGTILVRAGAGTTSCGSSRLSAAAGCADVGAVVQRQVAMGLLGDGANAFADVTGHGRVCVTVVLARTHVSGLTAAAIVTAVATIPS